MGQVIPFSKIESYLDGLEKQGAPKGTILDTNILISSSYELSDTQESVSEILDILNYKNYRLFVWCFFSSGTKIANLVCNFLKGNTREKTEKNIYA